MKIKICGFIIGLFLMAGSFLSGIFLKDFPFVSAFSLVTMIVCNTILIKKMWDGAKFFLKESYFKQEIYILFSFGIILPGFVYFIGTGILPLTPPIKIAATCLTFLNGLMIFLIRHRSIKRPKSLFV